MNILAGKYRLFILMALATLLISNCGKEFNFTPGNPEITAVETLAHLKYLADDARGGRFPGEQGSKEVARYIAARWKADGMMNFAGLQKTWQPFTLDTDVRILNGTLFSIGKMALTLNQDFIPMGFSSRGDFSGGIVYVNAASDGDTAPYKGNWVAQFMRSQSGQISGRGGVNAKYTDQIFQARDAKALGVIFISEPGVEGLEQVKFDRNFHDAGIAVVNISAGGAKPIFDALKITASAAWDASVENKEMVPVLIDGVEAVASVKMETVAREIGNVVAYLPGNDLNLKNQYIVIGAHYDHLGMGGPGTGSLSPDEETIHNGADDNASGVAGLLEIAQKFAAHQDELRRSMIFVAFDGEEQGLLGSKHFVDHSPIPIDSITLMINLDMIGRLRKNKLIVGGTGTSPIFERIIQEFNRGYQFDLQMTPEGPGPSDHASFYRADIPVLFFFTGAHEDYHKPTDDWEKIDTAGVALAANFAYDIASYFNKKEDRPQFTKAEPSGDAPTRRSFKVTLGIIPGYGAAVEGLQLDGVRDGGPADKAGLQRDDVIVSMDGKDVKSIQDYMYRLGELEPGQTIEVKVMRDGKVLSFDVTL